MSQKLVMKTEKKKLTLKELATFVKVAQEYGLPTTEVIDVSASGKEVMFSKVLPLKVRVVDGKRVVLRQKTKKQRAVEKQINDHNSTPVKEKPGYVPPEGRRTAPKVQKVKCPKCNVRKPVVKVAGVKAIKPHISKGDPCPGGGTQV